MEESNREDRANAKAWRSPTRLQKHAPTSLKLDQINNAAASLSHNASAIPLLSPLVLSPQTLPEAKDGLHLYDEVHSGDEKGVVMGIGVTLPVAGGWEHPAMSGLEEPLSLFPFFQSQGRLVDNVQ